MAWTEMPKSRTREAATSSCVESGLEAQSTTSAPPSRSVMARLAVSVVTCRHAEMRMPLSGWFLMNSLRILCSTGMDWLAHSMRRLPRSASSMFLMSNEMSVVVAEGAIVSCLRALVLGGMKDQEARSVDRINCQNRSAKGGPKLPELIARNPVSHEQRIFNFQSLAINGNSGNC